MSNQGDCVEAPQQSILVESRKIVEDSLEVERNKKEIDWHWYCYADSNAAAHASISMWERG